VRRKPRVRLSFEALAIEGYTNANKAERTISGKPNPHYMGENGAWGRYRSGWVALGSALQKLPSVGELGVVVTTYRASRKTSSRNEVEKIAKAAGRDGRLARHEDDELLALESRVSRLAPGEQGSRLGELASELLGERTGEAVDTHATFHKLRVRISKIDLSDTDVRAVSVFGPTQKPHLTFRTSRT